jgi:phosphoglycolate phosphatase-like HAD superfamily hydrolase
MAKTAEPHEKDCVPCGFRPGQYAIRLGSYLAHAAFSAKLKKLSELSGLHPDELIPEFRQIHQRHGTSEYAFAIGELPSLVAVHSEAQDLLRVYDAAMHAYHAARKRALKPYAGVRETLCELRARGCRIVAYTESLAFYSAQRLRDLDLDILIEVLYSPEDHELPRNMKPEDIRFYPPERYALRGTAQRRTPRGELKPNPDVLLSILRDVGVTPDRTIYVGDSRMKDIAMANIADITSVWAAYGAAQSRPEYELLRAVTHWTDADVEREKLIANGLLAEELIPDYELHAGIAELLDLFDFIVRIVRMDGAARSCGAGGWADRMVRLFPNGELLVSRVPEGGIPAR